MKAFTTSCLFLVLISLFYGNFIWGQEMKRDAKISADADLKLKDVSLDPSSGGDLSQKKFGDIKHPEEISQVKSEEVKKDDNTLPIKEVIGKPQDSVHAKDDKKQDQVPDAQKKEKAADSQKEDKSTDLQKQENATVTQKEEKIVDSQKQELVPDVLHQLDKNQDLGMGHGMPPNNKVHNGFNFQEQGGPPENLIPGDVQNHQDIFDDFDPYLDEIHDAPNIPLDTYDFDPSSGLTFIIKKGHEECVFDEVKDLSDKLSGAFVSSAANAEIDVTIKSPSGELIYKKYSEMEGEYDVSPKITGRYEICFSNIPYNEDKLVTHVTHTLKSTHPVEKDHVSNLAKYASHLDIRLGELESEQRLFQIRTDRQIKTEKSTRERVATYTFFECIAYALLSVLQVFYIKSLLDKPRHLLGL